MSGSRQSTDTTDPVATVGAAAPEPLADHPPQDQSTDPRHGLSLAPLAQMGERSRRILALGLVASIAALSAVGLAQTLAQSVDEPSAARQSAKARDEAAAEVAWDLETLMKADHSDAVGTFDSWAAVTTGRLEKQLQGQRRSIIKALRSSREVTRARTISAALTSWDEEAGSARLLAVLDLATSSTKGSSDRTVRYLAMAQRIDGTWRLAAVQQLGGAS